MVLILEYAGGEANCIAKMQTRPALVLPCPLCCLAPRPRTVDLLRECKRGTIQFVVVKPLAGLVSIVAVSQGVYYSLGYQIVMLVIYNIRRALAPLVFLYLFIFNLYPGEKYNS